MKTATPIAHTLRDVELVQLNTLVTEAGSVWELHFERMRTEEPDGESIYRDIWELRPRVTSKATTAPDAASHLTAAWNHVYGRSRDPRSAYREAATIPVVTPNNARATLGMVIGELRSTPQKWHVVLARDIELPRVVCSVSALRPWWATSLAASASPSWAVHTSFSSRS